MTHEVERLQKIASAYGELTDANGYAGVSFVEATEEVPAHFRIGLVQHPGKRSYLRTEIYLPLPENWNGCFLGQGIGGIGGYIPEPQLKYNVARGYATAASDLGTSKGRFSGVRNRDVWKDFGWRGNHHMTVTAKAILEAFYGRKENYAYFVGGSTGGQQGFSLAQRFPLDYSGIVAGVPAHDRVALHTYFLWNYNHLRTKTGKPLFTREEIAAITSHATAYAQSKGDGVKGDTFVTYPKGDDKTITELVLYIQSKMELSNAQSKALYDIYRGPRNPRTDKPIFGGMPLGSENNFHGMLICHEEICPNDYPFIWAFGKDYDESTFDFDGDYAKLRKALCEDLDANNPDLTPFCEAGGKLLIQSGAADSCVPFHATVKYLREVEQLLGKEKTDSFLRYYLYPGKGHSIEGAGCNRWYGGTFTDGSDATAHDELSLLRLWVEKGIAPNKMTAARVVEDAVEFTRLVSPFDIHQN